MREISDSDFEDNVFVTLFISDAIIYFTLYLAMCFSIVIPEAIYGELSIIDKLIF
jgi:hypothetical protein